MSVYRTEEEQLENIKNWWKRHSTLITLVFSLILLCFSVYKYWTWHQEKNLAQASNAYEQMMVAFANQNPKEVKAYANQLINEYSKTVYADVARMIKAKLLIDKEHIDDAKKLLEQVVLNSHVNALKQVARIRVARLLASEKSYDKALNQLSTVEDVAYMPLINELKGDIFAATGNFQQAILSYKEAISEVRMHGMGNLFLEMKTNELAAVTQVIDKNNGSVQAA